MISPAVFYYPSQFPARSTRAALDAASLLPPHGFLVDGGANGIQTVLAERLAMLPRPAPEGADIFFGFLQAHGPPAQAWTAEDHEAIAAMGPDDVTYIPNSMRLQVHYMCRQLSNTSFMRNRLPHLSRRTLRRHVILTPFLPGQCDYEARITGKSFPPISKWVSHILLTLNTDNLVSRGNIAFREISMPYLSSVRWSVGWSGSPPWQQPIALAGEGRSHLVCFTGSLRGQPQSVALRKRLVRGCEAQSARVCAAHVTEHFPIMAPEDAQGVERSNMRKALRLKLHSTFCLEPPGYSPPRKSSIDSMLSGCIPVWFYSDDEFDALWPFHLGGLDGWGANASVRVPLARALDGSIDVLRLLQDIPQQKVHSMRAVLAENAHRFVYGVGPYPGDAIDTMLNALSVGLSPSRTAAATW